METVTRFCQQCGARLAADSRFCEQCGQAIQSPRPPVADAPERVIGHLPVDFEAEGRWGRKRYRDGELLITTRRLSFVDRGPWRDEERWLRIEQRWAEAHGGDIDLVPLAALRGAAAAYDFCGDDWRDLVTASPDELVAASRHGFTLPLAEIVRARVTLDDEDRDGLDLDLEDGRSLHFELYLACGAPAARFLGEVLDPARIDTGAAAGRTSRGDAP